MPGFNPLERPFDYKHLTNTFQVASGPGMLHTITINRPDSTASAIITVYDGVGVTANIISIITMDKAVYVIPTTLVYDVGYLVGLYITFSNAVTADITVSYK
ncbi:MAG: hypothetical protein MUO61_03545 [Dehalococcoidia bacterium]|nr:hypothetical protein [Dehalococcoidia bacterium]